MNNENSHTGRNILYKWIWPLKFPNKIRYFLLLCTHDRLSTCDYLYHIGIKVEKTCYFCKEPVTLRHIFINCPNERKFWDALGFNHLICRIITNQKTKWLDSLKNESLIINKYLQWDQVIPFYLWNIWLVRNENYQN